MLYFKLLIIGVIIMSTINVGVGSTISHYRTTSPAETLLSIPITDSVLDSPPIDRRVIMSLPIGSVEVGDIIQVHSSAGFTNPVPYLVVIGTQIVISDSPLDISGIENIGGIDTQNVDHYLTHHISKPMSGSIQATLDIPQAYINYIAYSASGLKYSDAGGGVPHYVPGTLPSQQTYVEQPVAAPGHPTWAEYVDQYLTTGNVVNVDTYTGFISATIIKE